MALLWGIFYDLTLLSRRVIYMQEEKQPGGDHEEAMKMQSVYFTQSVLLYEKQAISFDITRK